jgi:hypothetical protein
MVLVGVPGEAPNDRRLSPAQANQGGSPREWARSAHCFGTRESSFARPIQLDQDSLLARYDVSAPAVIEARRNSDGGAAV